MADYSPFGLAAVNEYPDLDGDLVSFNLRFAGQYFDEETNLHCNYFRDYDPSLGRYIQSDPIGLDGGLNTYGYVGGNPLLYLDPKGENQVVIAILIIGGIGGAVAYTASDTAGKGFSLILKDRNERMDAIVTGEDPGIGDDGRFGRELLELAPEFGKFSEAMPKRGFGKDPFRKLKREAFQEFLDRLRKLFEDDNECP